MVQTTIRNIKASRSRLDEILSYYRQRFNSSSSQGKTLAATLHLAGRKLRLLFNDEAVSQAFLLSLKRAEQIGDRKESSDPGAVFYVWEDDIAQFYPEDGSSDDVWRLNNEHGKIYIPPGNAFLCAYDHDHQVGYFCLRPGLHRDLAYTAHPLKSLFHLWAEHQGLLFIHCAAVQIQGRGILIGGVGGRGKSTLAVNALLHGHKFVGDDYLLLDQRQDLVYPIYSSVYLNPDMAAKWPVLADKIIGRDKVRNCKTLIDLQAYDDLFLDKMHYELLLMPEHGVSDQDRIEPLVPGIVLAQLIFSSADQNMERMNHGFMQKIFARLKHLPVYKFTVGSDLNKNMSYLEAYLKGGKNV